MVKAFRLNYGCKGKESFWEGFGREITESQYNRAAAIVRSRGLFLTRDEEEDTYYLLGDGVIKLNNATLNPCGIKLIHRTKEGLERIAEELELPITEIKIYEMS